MPRALLEDLATRIAETGTSESIAQVHDQYLNFIVSEPDLFSLGMRKENTYWALNSARTKDEELDHVVDRIVSGLFSVMVTMGKIFRNVDEPGFTDASSCDAYHTLSERSCSRNDSSKTRQKTARPYPQFERQPLLFFE